MSSNAGGRTITLVPTERERERERERGEELMRSLFPQPTAVAPTRDREKNRGTGENRIIDRKINGEFSFG